MSYVNEVMFAKEQLQREEIEIVSATEDTLVLKEMTIRKMQNGNSAFIILRNEDKKMLGLFTRVEEMIFWIRHEGRRSHDGGKCV